MDVYETDALPKKRAKPVVNPLKPQWVENAVGYDKQGRMIYAPKTKAHLNEDKTFMVSYGEPVKKKRGRPRKIVS